MLGLTALVALQLHAAEIVVELDDSIVTVDATYRATMSETPMVIHVMRFPGQSFALLEPRVPSRGGDAAYEFRIPFAIDTEQAVRFRYQLTGAVTRIPIAVPEVSTVPGSGVVQLRVRGLSTDLDVRNGFPRLLRRADGTFGATLDNVPALLRQPPPRGAWSVNRAAEWFVVFLLVFGTGFWLVRRRHLLGRLFARSSPQ